MYGVEADARAVDFSVSTGPEVSSVESALAEDIGLPATLTSYGSFTKLGILRISKTDAPDPPCRLCSGDLRKVSADGGEIDLVVRAASDFTKAAAPE